MIFFLKLMKLVVKAILNKEFLLRNLEFFKYKLATRYYERFFFKFAFLDIFIFQFKS